MTKLIRNNMDSQHWNNLIDRFSDIPARLRAGFGRVGIAAQQLPAADGGWSVQQVLTHMRACDAIYTPRILALLVRDSLPAADIDDTRLTELLAGQMLDLSRALAHFETQRAEVAGALRSAAPDARAHVLNHETLGRQTLAELIAHTVEHEEQHCAQIEALAPRGARQTPERVHAAYNAVADAYADRFFDELQHKPFDRKMLDWLIQRVATNGVICDLGCGPGQVARYLHTQGAEVSGIDLSPEMVKIARAHNFGVSFEQGNMLDLHRVAGGAFAGIVAFYAIVNLSDEELPRAFGEMRRVLKPGGWLLLSFHVGDETRHIEEFLERKVALDFTFFQPAAIRAHLLRAGFNVSEVMVRDPYPSAEYPSQRAYMFAQARED